MSGVSLWVRRGWSHRWLGLVGLGLLIAVAGGVTSRWSTAPAARRPPSNASATDTNALEIQAEVQAPETENGIDVSVIPPRSELAERAAAVDGVEGVTIGSFVAAGIGDDLSTLFNRSSAERGRADVEPGRRALPR